MIRWLSLLALAALFAFAWSFGGADTSRLAGFEAGKLLDEPLEWISGEELANFAEAGDRIQSSSGHRGTVKRVFENKIEVEWERDADQAKTLPSPLGLHLGVTPRSLGLLLQNLRPERWRDLIRVGDAVAAPNGTPQTVEKIEDQNCLLEDETELPLNSIQTWLPAERTLLEVLEQSSLAKAVLKPGEQSKVKLHIGPVSSSVRRTVSRVPGEDPVEDIADLVDPTVHLKSARLSLVRRLRSHYSEEGKPALLDQDLTIADPQGPSFGIDRSEDGLLQLDAMGTLPGITLSAQSAKPLPSAWSLAPPLIAILLAILFRAPVLALLAGVLGGSWVVILLGGGSFTSALSSGTWAVTDTYLRRVLFDQFRFEIIAFVVAMLAMVGVMTRAGGIEGLMRRIARLAGNAKRTQLATWIMGLAVFFDDYANTILVGTTMRPLTDRVKVAREKLAYIVDSTAAPVAGLSLFSTWIAFEVSTFQSALPDAGLAVGDGYGIFLQTLPFRFYCLFTLAFVGMVVLSGRDFGPMLKAERRARGGQLLAPGAVPLVGKSATELKADPNVQPRAIVAVLPLITFVAVTIFSILKTGGAFSSAELGTLQGWANVLFDGSGSAPLLHGSLAGLGVAVLFALRLGLRGGLISAAWASIRSMGIALAILYLAWMLGEVCADLGTSSYLTVQLGDSISPIVLPIALFLLAALVAFSTGSSWSTMTILLPLVVALSFQLGETAAIGGMLLMIMSIGAVLEGAIFGDHCSPISDTTVMSSIASASDHIDHVRTQMPYALLTMSVAIVVGYLPCAYFGDRAGAWLPFACLALGMLVLYGSLRFFGSRVETLAPEAGQPFLSHEPPPA